MVGLLDIGKTQSLYMTEMIVSKQTQSDCSTGKLHRTF